MNVKGLVHVNINCSNFDRSVKFYELLGFQKVFEVPAKNTKEVAAAVGMPPYTVKGALLMLVNSETPFMMIYSNGKNPQIVNHPTPISII